MKKCQLLVFILYCIGQYKYSVLCVESSNVELPTPTKFDPDFHSDDKESIRPPRELNKIDFMTKLNDFTNQERTLRGVLESRRHLKPHDAHKVADYFIMGGPLKGHNHFVRASNCDPSNPYETDTIGMSNPSNENTTDSIVDEENSSTNSSDSIVGVPHIPRLPVLYHPRLTKLTAARLNPLLNPALRTLTAVPHIPRASLLHSVLHPVWHPHLNKLHSLPSTLMRAATLPVHGLLRAQSELHNMLLPTLPLHQPLRQPLHVPLLQHLHMPLQTFSHSPLVGSTNSLLSQSKDKDNSVSDSTYLPGLYSPMLGASPTTLRKKIPLSNVIHPNILAHPPPIGYVVKYVPYGEGVPPSSPVVGSPQQQPFNYIDNNLNTQQNIGSVNDEDKVTNNCQQDEVQSENGTTDESS